MFQLASIIILGVLAQWIAWRIKVPAILPLILIGLFVGPLSFLWTGTDPSIKYIEPIFNNGSGLWPSENFFYFVTLAIGIILFEGGLTLNRNEIKGIGGTIINLITVGSLVTFVGGALAAHFIMDLNWSISFLFSALIIVTGPTVIAPILRNVALKSDVSNVLKWEGILIDPIGALAAVLVFEFIHSGAGTEFGQHAIIAFVRVLVIGFGLGFLFALFFRWLLQMKFVPHYLLNVFTLAIVLFVFVLSDILSHESGLLSVVVMGMVLGNMNLPEFKEILHFKETLSVLLISILFILLSANINYEDLMLLLDWRCGVLFLVVILILRPIGVFLSTRTAENLGNNEKAYISWVGPRGIVAAGIASLFGIRLSGEISGAEYITPLVFMIVLGTVLLNATTARWMARMLNVVKSASDGILIIGAGLPSRLIGKFIMDQGRHVILLDRSDTNIKAAKDLGMDAIAADIYSEDLSEKFDLLDVGYLMAMTPSTDVNNFAIQRLKDDFGENEALRVLSSEELKNQGDIKENEILFSKTDDYINISELARDYPEFHEIPVDGIEDFQKLLSSLRSTRGVLPIFYFNSNRVLKIIDAGTDLLPDDEGVQSIVYMGRKLEELHSKADSTD